MKFFIALLALFLLGCTPSSLTLEKSQKLILNQNSKEYTFSDRVLNQEKMRFINIDVERYEIQNSSSKRLFFEQLYTETNHEWRYGSVETLKSIFDVYNSNTLYFSATLLLIQFEIEPDKYVNILAETSGTQDISYIYGFSNEEYKKVIKDLGVEVRESEIKKAYEVREPLTKWTQKHLILFPLLQPVFRRGSF